MIHERARCIHGSCPKALADAEFRHIRGKQTRHLNHRVTRFGKRRYRECHHNGVVIRGLHGHGDGGFGVSRDGVIHVEKMHPVAAEFPAHHAIRHLVATVTHAGHGF